MTDEKFILVPNDATVILPHHAVERANEMGMKAAAESYGVSYTKLHRFISDAGYSLVRTHQWQLQLDDPDNDWARPEPSTSEPVAPSSPQPAASGSGFGDGLE